MASVLETFFILFEADATDVKKGADEAKKATKDLERELSATDTAANKVGGSFLSLSKSAAGALGALAGAFVAGSQFFAAVDYADKLDETSGALDASVEDLDAWGGAVKLAGGDAQTFYGTLENLAAGMAQVDTLGKSRMLPFFKELGVSMLDAEGKTRPVLDLLPELAGAFEGLSKQQALGMGKKLGLDAGTIMLLQQGRRAVEDQIRRQKEQGVVTAQQAETAAKFNDQIDYTARAFRSLYVAIGSAILPGLTSFLRGLESGVNWVRKNSDFVTGFFIAVGGVVAALYVPSMLSAAAATLAATWPIIAIIAAVTAFGLVLAAVYDDIVNFMQGNDSLLGSFVKFVTESPTFIAAIDAIGASFEWIQGVIRGVIDLVQFAGEAWQKFKGFVGGKIDAAMNAAVSVGQSALAAAGATPIGAATSAAITNAGAKNTSNSVQIAKVEVNTQATDADGIAKGIGDSLGSQMKQAVNTFDDGVKG